MDGVKLPFPNFFAFPRERLIALRWWLVRVFGLVFVGHGWQRFEEGLDLNSDGAKGGLEVVGRQQ